MKKGSSQKIQDLNYRLRIKSGVTMNSNEILRSLRSLRMTMGKCLYPRPLRERARERGKCNGKEVINFKPAFTLAEGATHVAMPPVFSKAGFTLAEVLITIGIIGVVAALTIPVLIANTTSQKYRSKFKKTISTLSQAARMSEAQYGFDYSGINIPCSENGGTEHPESIMSVCSIINGTIKSATYFRHASDIKLNKAGKTESYSITSNFTNNQVTSLKNLYDVHAYVLNDGTIIAFSRLMGQHGCSLKSGEVLKYGYSDTNMASCAGFIDVNGVDLPNKEVSCSSGSNSLAQNNCIVKNNAKDLTDIYPIRFHDGVVEPATAAARYVLRTTK